MDDNNEYDYFKCITNCTLPIAKIANSTWAQNTFQSFLADRNTSDNVWLANNGIDLNTFKNLNLLRERRHEKHIYVISDSGRGVDWNGFKEMASAMKIAKCTARLGNRMAGLW